MTKPNILLTLLFLLAGGFDHVGFTNSAEPLEREVYLMGTSFHVVLYEPDREKGIQQLEEIIRMVEAAEDELSTWRSQSEISRLNEQPVSEAFVLSPSLCSLWKQLEKSVSESNGAFDPSVGRLTALWGIHEMFRIPGETEIAAALETTGFQYFQRNDCTITKTRAVLIDVGAFGKGEALDRVLKLAEQEKIGPLMIDFGGQLVVRGSSPGEKGWTLWLADPVIRSKESSIKILLTSGSLSTSGGSERDGEVNGKRIGHHINPKTGYPIDFFGSITVWRPSALEADALSTALYVMGPKDGYEWALKRKIPVCYQIIKGGNPEVLMTPDFRSLLAK